MQFEPCTECGMSNFDVGGFGLDFCLNCGLGRASRLETVLMSFGGYPPQDSIAGHQSYTRMKRFKKYLCRAMRQQSNCTVPRETWDYLFERRPYRGAKHIQLTLKQARHLKRKCYDSLPFLTAMLCPKLEVPTLSQREKNRAIRLFRIIDDTIREGPFISYLYCLEYILCHMGREDMCPHINKIQCPKRRTKYKARLDAILKKSGGPENIRYQLRTRD